MNPPALTERDREQIAAHGLDLAEVERQLRLFAAPPPRLRLLRPCRVGDGIVRIEAGETAGLVAAAEQAARSGRFRVFVPASGAATRMFESLLAATSEPSTLADLERRAGAGDAASADATRFWRHRHEFPFHDDLLAAVRRRGGDPEDVNVCLAALLAADGLAYGDLPKALVAFHRAGDGPRTPFEEQILEAAAYATDAGSLCRVHFTIAACHEPAFRNLAERTRVALARTAGIHLEVDFSHQDPATDTIAVDLANRPFRQPDGSLLFRPGGHGALLANLSALQGDIVFVKNIDNSLPERGRPRVVLWKKLLGGLLVRLQSRIFEYLERLESAEATPEDLASALAFAEEELGYRMPAPLRAAALERRRQALLALLDRPLRVCGVVANQGQPGGGPFWVEGPRGDERQIVEAAQVDPDSDSQREIWSTATHFNPVDIVCGLRDRLGRQYDLRHWVDRRAILLSTKFGGGRRLKVLEHPGLWNGGMARWNTVFVEVPAETFAPVKTVLDLLRPEHRP